MSNKKSILFMTTLAILISIEIIISTTTLGSLPAIGPIVMTVAHIPVIIGAVVLGFKGGIIMGFVYGLLSFLVWTFAPSSPVAFLFTPFYSVGQISGNFWSLIICFVPRILLGILSYLFIKVLFRPFNSKFLSNFVGAALANIISSGLLLFFVYIFFRGEYATVLGIEYKAVKGVILLTIVTSSIPESILGGAVTLGVDKLFRSKK